MWHVLRDGRAILGPTQQPKGVWLVCRLSIVGRSARIKDSPASIVVVIDPLCGGAHQWYVKLVRLICIILKLFIQVCREN